MEGKRELYIRNFVFGVEDALVSTVGLLSGIAIAGIARETIVLTGTVLIFVEAFSMAVGSFLSEHTAEDYELKREAPARRSVMAALVMFFSYFIFGFVPLTPYFVSDPDLALVFSIIISLIFLALLGVLGGRLSKTSIIHEIFRMVVIGGIAIAIGVIVGKWLA